MKSIRAIVALAACAALVGTSLADAPKSGEKLSAHEKNGDDFGLFRPAEIKWQDAPPSLPPGAKIALLEGDPAKEGPFVIRFKSSCRTCIPRRSG
jgi:hypothetical protein